MSRFALDDRLLARADLLYQCSDFLLLNEVVCILFLTKVSFNRTVDSIVESLMSALKTLNFPSAAHVGLQRNSENSENTAA